MKPIAAYVLAAFVTPLVFSGVAQAEQICVEEAAGVCLKYGPAPAPKESAGVASARQAEAALRMSGADRRAVQRGLAAAGLYAGGIDGQFGPGTRRAIRDWQRRNGGAVTGYLKPGEETALRQAGAVRQPAQTQAPRAASFQGRPVIDKGVPDGAAFDLEPDAWLRFDKPRGFCIVWKSHNSSITYENDANNGWTYIRARSTAIRVRITRVKKGRTVWGFYCN